MHAMVKFQKKKIIHYGTKYYNSPESKTKKPKIVQRLYIMYLLPGSTITLKLIETQRGPAFVDNDANGCNGFLHLRYKQLYCAPTFARFIVIHCIAIVYNTCGLYSVSIDGICGHFLPLAPCINATLLNLTSNTKTRTSDGTVNIFIALT